MASCLVPDLAGPHRSDPKVFQFYNHLQHNAIKYRNVNVDKFKALQISGNFLKAYYPQLDV